VRHSDLEEIARRLERTGARFAGRLTQTDTYFAVPEGRLKLREYTHEHPDGHSTAGAELIRYERPDAAGARVSDYARSEVADPPARLRELAERHGLRGVVRKRRDLWLLRSTRIHLDTVDGLGRFVELETVFGNETDDASRAEHEAVLATLAIDPIDAIGGSYVDLRGGTHGSPTDPLLDC